MTTSFDVQDLAKSMGELLAHEQLHKVAIVLPLADGMRATAREFLAEGPPYDLQRAGVDAHEVFLTDAEVVFVFGTPEGPATLNRILEDEEFWSVVSSWEHIAAGPPRFAEVAYDWRPGA